LLIRNIRNAYRILFIIIFILFITLLYFDWSKNGIAKTEHLREDPRLVLAPNRFDNPDGAEEEEQSPKPRTRRTKAGKPKSLWIEFGSFVIYNSLFFYLGFFFLLAPGRNLQ